MQFPHLVFNGLFHNQQKSIHLSPRNQHSINQKNILDYSIKTDLSIIIIIQ